MNKKSTLLVLLLLPFMALAQMPLTVVQQDNIKLPWGLNNLTILDGRLLGNSKGVMLSAPIHNKAVYYLQPDTLERTIKANFSFAFRHPIDSTLYFSHMDEDKHRLGLFTHTQERRSRNKKIDFRGWFRDICHPTISPDGSMIVFSSQGKIGLGGQDLWCSFWNGKRWSKPINMGGVINTAGHEVDPVFYGQFLIYSSSESLDSNALYHFHAVKIPAHATAENILFDQFKVQRLPEPLNSNGSDRSMAVDLAHGFGFWTTTRNGKTELYCFDGSLEGVILSGTVAEERGRRIANASVKVLRNGRLIASTTTDSTGFYQLVILPGNDYEILVSKPNYFNYSQPLTVLRTNEDQLVSPVTKDISLEFLHLNRIMVFDHIYRPGAEAEISAEGANALSPLVNYLRDNPHVSLQLTLFCSETADSTFNNLLINQRIINLQQYFSTTLPSISQISFKNGNTEGKNESPKSSKSSIFAVFSIKDK